MNRVLALLLSVSPAFADPPVIENVQARQTGDSWHFDVTLSHPDTGWEHYADGWRVLDMDGNELGTRTLYHPHVEEQPFTRSLTGVSIPSDMTQVKIQAHCQVDGWSETTFTVPLN